MPKRYIRGDKVISYMTPPPVLLVLRRKPPTPLDSYSPQGEGRRQYRQKMPQWCSVAQWPNIIGNVGWDANGLLNYATGVFSGVAKTGPYVASGSSAGGVPYSYANFSASRSSSLYSGAKLQSPAFQTLIIIKVWIAFGWTLDPLYAEFAALAEK